MGMRSLDSDSDRLPAFATTGTMRISVAAGLDVFAIASCVVPASPNSFRYQTAGLGTLLQCDAGYTGSKRVGGATDCAKPRTVGKGSRARYMEMSSGRGQSCPGFGSGELSKPLTPQLGGGRARGVHVGAPTALRLLLLASSCR